MDHGEVTAGDLAVSMLVTFDQPSTCSRGVSILLGDSSGNQGLVFRGTLEAGSATANLSVDIPKDYQGEFHFLAPNANLFACQGYSLNKQFTVSPITLKVKGIPNPNNYPANALIALSLTQKQFLNTKIAELNGFSVQIDTRVERNGRDSLELRTFLAEIVTKAATALQETERQYQRELLKATDTSPAFFADFKRQYAALHDELKAPIPGTSATLSGSAQLLYVQEPLKRKTPVDGRNISGTSPVIARAVKDTLKDNAAAYGIVAVTGNSSRPEFHARFQSFPPGATIYYRQAILTDFKVWPSQTNISDASFTLATFIFKFHSDECEDEEVVQVDPYDDPHPNVSVEFKRCKKR